MKGEWIPYTAEELAWIEARKADPRHETHAAFCERFGRSDVSLQNLNALCKRNGWLTGRTGRFNPGDAPFNKGRPCPPDKGGRHPNARRTQFKAGQMSGTAKANYKPIGYERTTEDGYRERKIGDTGKARDRWRGVHLLNWEAIHGPLPAGHALKCLDGNKLNTDPSNWEALPRAVLARLNGGRFKKRLAYDDAPPELKPTVIALAKLQHAARTRRDSDTRRKAETGTGSVRSTGSAGPQGIAQPSAPQSSGAHK